MTTQSSELESIAAEAQQAVVATDNLQSLREVKARLLGKKSRLAGLLGEIAKLPAEERPQAGQAANRLKREISSLISDKEKGLENSKLKDNLHQDSIDVTLPGRGRGCGSLHPITQMRDRIERIFARFGFTVTEGPEMENEEYNFRALNIPDHHPAREMQDTFYLQNGKLLRTHTSPVQIRIMQKQKPPLRIIVPGRVYRPDFDVTHTPMFHQVEGLMVDENVSFAELKWVLSEFSRCLFERDLATRFRPSYFPFTEPSAEMDVACTACHGKKGHCRVCKDSGWLEVLGCGMVHPNVLRYAGIDSERYTGFAFGIGIDRLTMQYYGINDLRMMFENDVRFLRQF